MTCYRSMRKRAYSSIRIFLRQFLEERLFKLCSKGWVGGLTKWRTTCEYSRQREMDIQRLDRNTCMHITLWVCYSQPSVSTGSTSMDMEGWLYIYWKNSEHKWTRAVPTHVVQGLTVYSMNPYVNLRNAIISQYTHILNHYVICLNLI